MVHLMEQMWNQWTVCIINFPQNLSQGNISDLTFYHRSMFPGSSFRYLNWPNLYPTEPMKAPMELSPFQHAFIPNFSGKEIILKDNKLECDVTIIAYF